jgi:predicted TIM-barrel fold metal-dependent hydrolase
MARNGYKIMDSDLHVMEPSYLYERYLEPKYLSRAPKWEGGWRVQDASRGSPSAIEREMVSRRLLGKRKAEYYEQENAQGYTPELTLKAMDREGIDLAVMFRSMAHMHVHVDGQDPEYSIALCRAFNGWLADFCRMAPQKMKGSGILVLNNIPGAVKEAERCVKDLGMVSLTLIPSAIDERQLHDPEIDPLWTTLQDLGVPITFHDTAGGYARRNAGYQFREHPNNLVLTHTFAFPISLMTAVGSLTAGGVLQRFPRLKAGFLEGNCSWLPWLLYRLDEQWEIFGEGQDTPLKQMPSEYFKERCFISVESDGELLHQVIEAVGDDNIVISTDYPHTDSNYPFSMDKFLSNERISPQTRRKILWDNCARLYGLS